MLGKTCVIAVVQQAKHPYAVAPVGYVEKYSSPHHDSKFCTHATCNTKKIAMAVSRCFSGLYSSTFKTANLDIVYFSHIVYYLYDVQQAA